MALEHILDAIRQDGEAELAALRAASDAEVRRIQAEARQDAQRAVEAALSEDAIRTTLAARRIEGAAAADAERVMGDAREHVFQELLGRVRDRLAHAHEAPDWPDVFRALFAEAHACVPDATAARVRPRDAALIAELAPDLEIADDLDGWGGVVLAADDGRRVDNTLETRLQTALPELRRVALGRVPALGRQG